MKITKGKEGFNTFDIRGLSAGKLMAIHESLKESEKNGKLGPVGKDVLNLFDRESKNFLNF